MAMFWPVTFETPDGDKLYILRESAPEWMLQSTRVTAQQVPGSPDTLAAEDWGPGMEGPFVDVMLRRTDQGWIEER